MEFSIIIDIKPGEVELIEQDQREACERGECEGAPVCGYCLDLLDEKNQEE